MQEFFIRKAIGWALREYAYTDAEWVRSFVREHREALSGLSVREALRVVGEIGEGEEKDGGGRRKGGSREGSGGNLHWSGEDRKSVV